MKHPGGAGAGVGGGANHAGGTGPGGRGSAGNGPNGGVGNGPNGGVGNGPGGGNFGAGGEIAIGAGGGAAKVFDAGQDPARNRVLGGQVCERIATIQCAGEAFCCDAPGRTEADCKQTMKQGCINSLYLDAITADARAGYDTNGAEAIFTEFERLASTCDQSVTAWGASLQGLRGLAKGTLRSGVSCMPPLAQISNRTVAAPYLAACLNADTTACYPTATTWTCSPRGNANSRCFADTNCNDPGPPGLYCDNPKFLVTGSTCKQRKPDGSPCALLNECASLLCKQSQCAPLNQQNAFCLN